MIARPPPPTHSLDDAGQRTLAFVYGNDAELLVNEEINREVGAFLRGKELRLSPSPLRPNRTPETARRQSGGPSKQGVAQRVCRRV